MNSPKPELAKLLERAEIIKQEMAKLLVELEAHATDQVPEQTGAWRHHPGDWLNRHPPK